MLKTKIVLLLALVSCALITGCNDEKNRMSPLSLCTLRWSKSVRQLLVNLLPASKRKILTLL